MAQNVCIRYTNKVSRFDRITPILNEMKVLNMCNRRLFLSLCYLHKILAGGSAPYLRDIFIKNKNNTRAGQDTYSLVVSQIRGVQNEHLLSHCLSKSWNNLPTDIRNISSHNAFRNALFNYLLEDQTKG